MQATAAQPQRWRILAALQDERGAIGFNMLWVCCAIIFLIPFFWDVSSLFYARRFAGASADAASLAAAQEYARQLEYTQTWQGLWRGRCDLHEYTQQQVVQRYSLHPALLAPPDLGYPAASSYAQQNNATLKSYSSTPVYAGQIVAGVVIPQIEIAAATERQVFMAYQPLYQREFQAPNHASALAYLARWSSTPRTCGGGTTYDFSFEWKVTLTTSISE